MSIPSQRPQIVCGTHTHTLTHTQTPKHPHTHWAPCPAGQSVFGAFSASRSPSLSASLRLSPCLATSVLLFFLPLLLLVAATYFFFVIHRTKPLTIFLGAQSQRCVAQLSQPPPDCVSHIAPDGMANAPATATAAAAATALVGPLLGRPTIRIIVDALR